MYLLDRKIKQLDYIIISHFDSDHCNGLIEIIKNFKVKLIVFSKQPQETKEFNNILNIIKNKNIKIKIVKQGDKINIDKYVYIDIIYPKIKQEYEDLNNNSIVLKISYYKFSILFTGDISQEIEKELINEKNKEVKEKIKNIDILKVSHHRSKIINRQKFYRLY